MNPSLQQISKQDDDNVEKVHEDMKDFKAVILRQIFEVVEFNVPRLFIILPEDTERYNPTYWFHLNYRLYFLCECANDNERHFAFHEGYKIRQPREFLRKYGPYLRQMLTVVKYAMSAGSLAVPQLAHIASGISATAIAQNRMLLNNLNVRAEQLNEILMKAEESINISTQKNSQYVEGTELREMQTFLKKVDVHQTYGNLFRSIGTDGSIRWVCIHHCESKYGDKKMQELHEEFQNLGGEIKEDIAVIGRQTSNNISKILSVLNRGLFITTIILKNLNLEEEKFDMLLKFISEHSLIHYFEIENINVLHKLGYNVRTHEIIEKLDHIVRKNGKLQIQYGFIRRLSRFDSSFINTITVTNSRLVFRVRSQEQTPSLELAGMNGTGFTLSITDGQDTDNNRYETAIENMFSLVPHIVKIHFHNGMVSNSIWTCFYQYLTRQPILQELTIDCRLTLQQTKALSFSLSGNRTLKTLHMNDVWETEDETNGCEEIFKMIQKNVALIEFALTCHSYALELAFIARYLIQNKSLRSLRLPKCWIDQNMNTEPIENFLLNTSITNLSFELINTNCDHILEPLANAIDRNESLEILQLIGLECSATVYRRKTIPVIETKIPLSESIPIMKRSSSRTRLKELFSCHMGGHRSHSHEDISRHAQKKNEDSIFNEPFYALCNYPHFYKQIHKIAGNLKIEELQVTIEAHVEMRSVALSMESNSTVTHLKIAKRILTEDDIPVIVQGISDNRTIIELYLNEINMRLSHFHQIFDALHHNQIFRVLNVKQPGRQSDRNLFIGYIKKLTLTNPYLKVVY